VNSFEVEAAFISAVSTKMLLTGMMDKSGGDAEPKKHVCIYFFFLHKRGRRFGFRVSCFRWRWYSFKKSQKFVQDHLMHFVLLK
jgi:hypothetical protein